MIWGFPLLFLERLAYVAERALVDSFARRKKV